MIFCPSLAIPDMKERTILVSGFSKAFAMTGWRIGYMCGHPELIAAMLKIHAGLYKQGTAAGKENFPCAVPCL